jgi:hypothetical protein
MEVPSAIDAVVQNIVESVKTFATPAQTGGAQFLTPKELQLVVTEGGGGYTSGASSVSSGGSALSSGGGAIFGPAGPGEEALGSVARVLDVDFENLDQETFGAPNLNPLGNPVDNIPEIQNWKNPLKEEQLEVKFRDELLVEEKILELDINPDIPYLRIKQKLNGTILIHEVEKLVEVVMQTLERKQIRALYERKPANPKGLNCFDASKYNVTMYIVFRFVELERENGIVQYLDGKPLTKEEHARTIKAFPMEMVHWKTKSSDIMSQPVDANEDPRPIPESFRADFQKRRDGESLSDWKERMREDLYNRLEKFLKALDEQYEWQIDAVIGDFTIAFLWTGDNRPKFFEAIERIISEREEEEQEAYEEETREMQRQDEAAKKIQRQWRKGQYKRTSKKEQLEMERRHNDPEYQKQLAERNRLLNLTDENRENLTLDEITMENIRALNTPPVTNPYIGNLSRNTIDMALAGYDKAQKNYTQFLFDTGRRPSAPEKQVLENLKNTVLQKEDVVKNLLVNNGVPNFNFTSRWNKGEIAENTGAMLKNMIMQYAPVSRLFGARFGCSQGSKEITTRGEYVLWSTSTKKKRCAIYCVMKKLGIGAPVIDEKTSTKAKSTKEEWIQKFLTHQYTTDQTQIEFPMPVSQFPRLAYFFKCNIKLYTWNEKEQKMEPLLDENQKEWEVITNEEAPLVKMMLENSHAFLIVKDGLENISKKVCPHCRTIYTKEHNTCNQSKIAFLNRRAEKNKKEISANEKFVQSINNRQCIFFDCETFTDEQGEHIPYAVGWGIPDKHSGGIKRKKENDIVHINWEFKYEWGEGCMQRFIEWLKLYSATSENGKKPAKKILIGFNNANYDNLLLAKTCIKMGMHFDFQIQNNALIGMQGTTFKTWDLCRFLPGQSLESACKSFGASDEDAKTHFPHKFITGWDKLEYVGVEPGPEYHWKAPSNWSYVTTPTWNLKEVCLNYLEKDIKSTIFVFNKLQETCFHALHVDIKEFITASHMSYDVWTNLISNAPKETNRFNPFQERKQIFNLYYPTVEQEDVFRQAIYGGRTYNTARKYESKFYEKVIQGENVTYESIDDWMDVFDVVSLYASAMLFNDYPYGVCTNSTEEELSEISSLIENNKYEEVPLGIFKVKYVPNKKLIIPALPRKTFRRKPDGTILSQGLIWDLQDSEGYYTTVDIIEAKKQGYTFEFISGIQWPNKGPIFEKYIELALELKCKGENEGNETLRSLGKLLCNALYGKMLQRPIIENSALVKDAEDLNKFLATNNLTEIIFLNDQDKRLLVKGDECQRELKIRKPSFIGAFVLSYSRKIMHNFAGMADPWRGSSLVENSMKNSFMYTDTDSLFYRTTPHILNSLKSVLKENQPGNLWYDLKGKPPPKILKAIFLGPKTYLLIYFTKDGKLQSKMRSKGIPSALLTQDDYINLLETSKVEKKEVNQIRKVMHSKKDQIPFTLIATNVQKCLMKSLWKGRVFLDDETSLPFGHEDLMSERNISEEEMIAEESF